MASLHPPLSRIHPTTAGAYRERDILQMLEQGLPASYDVFHSVDWANVYQGNQTFGEFDVVVLSPLGHVLVLEVKAGSMQASAQGLSKQYRQTGGRTTVKDVGQQAHRQRSAVVNMLQTQGLEGVRALHLLVLADYTVEQGSVAYPREYIVDATELPHLCNTVVLKLQHNPVAQGVRERVFDFLCNRFALYPDAATHVGQVQRTNIALAEGLATWVPRISHSSGMYQIHATAGSGKTQLAIALLQAAAQQGLRAAYVCYNRPLADHMVQVAPHSVEVSTFHEYCVGVANAHGLKLDFSNAQVFDELTHHLLAHCEEQPARLDLLIVDEAQDFDPQWVQALLPRLKSDGRMYAMGDGDQELYGRDAFDLPDAVQVQCLDNFRSPKKVVQAINQFALCPQRIKACSAFEGQAPDFHTYQPGKAQGTKASSSTKALEACVKGLLGEGFSPKDIAVLTFMGRSHSEVLQLSTLAGESLRTFTGKYDVAGNAVWTAGSIVAESVYRFKGQSAPVVVLCEVDFEQLTDKVLRKLFVGFTRAQFRLECVLSERAAQALMERI